MEVECLNDHWRNNVWLGRSGLRYAWINETWRASHGDGNWHAVHTPQGRGRDVITDAPFTLAEWQQGDPVNCSCVGADVSYCPIHAE